MSNILNIHCCQCLGCKYDDCSNIHCCDCPDSDNGEFCKCSKYSTDGIHCDYFEPLEENNDN